jgi:indoleamine 2,3-dioxygenase
VEAELSLLKRGFLPDNVCTKLNSEYLDLEDCLSQLPKLLITRTFKQEVLKLRIYTKFDSLTTDELERAMLLYSYLGHAHMWGEKAVPTSIPENVSRPWVEIAKLLNRPPILSYASYALNNWVSIQDSEEALEVENIIILQNFLGGVDEDWFIMIHVAIEFEAKNLLYSLGQYFLSEDKEGNLEKALESINKINKIMDRMPEHCDPYIYYNRVRPYIFGWKNNPATPNGVIYEGVEEFSNEPKFFRGETGAQSSIIPAVDALLGVGHSEDPLRFYLDEMRDYMPFEHRELLNKLDSWRSKEKNKKAKSNKEQSSLDLIGEIISEVKRFRNTHLTFAKDYIHKQSKDAKTNSNSVGTGGTPFMQYLEKHLDETVPNA